MKNINFFDYTNNIKTLDSFLSLGYVDESHGVKIDKFARAELQNNVLATVASFNEGISVNTFKPFNDSLLDLNIVSDSASDTHEITINYVNGDRDLKVATVTLQGTTPINLSTLFNDSIYCVWRMTNKSNRDNIGTISVQSVVGETYCNMPITSGLQANNSLTSIFSVPRGYIGLITKVSISTDKGADAKGAIFTREENQVFRYVKALASYQNQSLYNDIYAVVSEKTDLLPVAIAQTGGILYLDYTVLLLKKEFVGKNLKGNDI